MISQRVARTTIQQLWRTWRGRTGAPGDKRAFYEWLEREQPRLLAFKADGDKWELVKLWLFGK
jgi:hypothetical protein